MTKTAINVDHIARVEGHGNVHVAVEDGVVTSVEMNVIEPARLFESMVCGRPFEDGAYVASRICGICSSSHVVTDLLAIEAALGITVTDRTQALRELLVYGSYLQNHATHLYVFAAPDYLGMESVFPLSEADPELFAKALSLKALGNELCTAIGGRSVHPITAVVGGFTHEIAAEEYLRLADKLQAMVPFVMDTVDLFRGWSGVEMRTKGNLLAMVQEGYYPVCTSDEALFVRTNERFKACDVNEAIEEYAVPHSAALLAKVRSTGSPFFTGALARINASWDNLTQEAKIASAKAGLRPPELNPFANNISQAVELVDVLSRCSELCRRLAETDGFEGASTPQPFEVHAGYGVGFTEAPRGTLFHEIELDEQGKILHASIMTPTALNVANLESDMYILATKLVAAGVTEDALRLEIEKLVRAYDPCLSCSVH